MTTPPAGRDPSSADEVPELVSLLLRTTGVDEVLQDLSGVAARAFAGVQASCGITLRRHGRPMTPTGSDDLARAVDEAQYGQSTGPCLESLATGEVVAVPDVAAEQRWGRYPAQALALGVASSLSAPLTVEGDTVGALNLYARTPHAFDDAAVLAQVSALAAQGGAVLTVVLRQARQTQLTDQLRETLSSRAVIDQAIGIIMAQQRCPASEAFGYLRTASQNRNRKLRDIAADVITSATGAPPEPTRFGDPR